MKTDSTRTAPGVATVTALEENRFGLGTAAAAYAIATLLLAWPALLGRFLVGPHSDQYIAGYAFREFAASFLRETGSFPLWNPYLFGGMPYVAAMHGDIFYPTFLLRMILPTDVAMTWSFIIHVFLAGTFTYVFLRAAGFGFGGALTGGLAYMLAGQVASLVSPGHDGKIYVSALFPLALLCLLRGVRDGRRWAWGLLALVVGLAVLSPHPQLLQYMLLASGSYALFLAIREKRSGNTDAATAVRRLGFALGAVVIGGAIGAIQYLPVSEYVSWSPRAGGIRRDMATTYAWNPEELLNAYLPQFTGMLESYWGRNGLRLHSDYIGASVLLIAGAAFAGVRADKRRGEILFWMGALLIALLWALGANTPFYQLPYTLIPGTKFFRAPDSVFFVGTFAIAFLTAVGTERVLRREVSVRYLAGWAGFAALLAVLATTGILLSVAQSLARPEVIDLVESNAGSVTLGAWRSLLVVLVTAGLAYGWMRGRVNSAIVVWALALVVTGDLYSVMRRYWSFSPPASELYRTDATIDYLKGQRHPGRVLSLGLQPTRSGRDPNITGDGLMVHRLRTLLGYHGNELGRFDVLGGKERGYDQIANPNFWRLTNTQYVLTDVDSLPVPGANRVAGPARTAAGTIAYLYRLPGDQPLAWVAPLIVKAPDEAVLATVLDPRFDVGRAALFDTSAAVRAVQSVSALPAPSSISVSVVDFQPGKISLTLSEPAPAGSALVVSENFYPGWRAEVDGRAAPVGRADFTFIGVELPAGGRAVSLNFHSEAYRRGKLVTLIALALALISLAAGVGLDRRKLA